MINGQDALLLVASLVIKHENNMNERYLVQELANSINTTIPRASFLVQLMVNNGYLSQRRIHERTVPLISVTPKTCARVREINAQRRELQLMHDHEDAIARAEAMGDYERASRLTRELLEA